MRTFKPRDEYDITDMVAALDFAKNNTLSTEQSLLRLVNGCKSESAIVDKLGTTGFSVGLAVLLAEVLAPLLGIQPVFIGQGKQKHDGSCPGKPCSCLRSIGANGVVGGVSSSKSARCGQGD